MWQGSSNGAYIVKSDYRLATEKIEPNNSNFVAGDWLKLWHSDVLNKVKCFPWRAVRRVLPDRENL